ncbi:AAA family ATPase [Bradyrhizobium sp. JYMT SZCCT0428]|uniref:AAA family ATPase n=1 Tax=Bradyrhizobium sp. JYMT SZCCT0428 TaxID=2807673 RepID=UPI001BAD8ED8|nr:AAA family ATPase [Bradyrhizobium sp. JYMT SZCCT0428]MBR1156867.1 AAA family ATPase [Bradyrhizobium sp. JYMT SZCCT0428]
MSRALSAPAKVLLSNSRNLSDAAAFLQSDMSTFGKWCIPGLLPKQGTAAIYGPTGSGKTFFAVHLALSKAAGLPWFGPRMEAGTVVYLVTEDRLGVEARAVAAAKHMGLKLEDTAFEFLTPFAIHVEDWANSLIEVLSEIQIRNGEPIAIVFLDTLGAAFGGRSQDDAAQMTLVADAMQAIAEHFKCVFVVVHHSGKNAAKGMRGSQVLKDRVDAVIELSKTKGDMMRIEVEKQRNGAPGAPLTCRLSYAKVSVGGGRVESTRIVTEVAIAATSPMIARAPAKPVKLARDEKAVFDAMNATPVPLTVRNFDLLTRAALIAAKPRKDGAVRTAISHTKKQLLSKKIIEIDEQADIVRICQKTSELENS